MSSLKSLKDHTGVTDRQLDQEVSDDDLDTLSQDIVEYRKYGSRLGLNDADIRDIEQHPAVFYSLKAKASEVFKLWHSRKRYEATYRFLLNVAFQLNDGNAAEKICHICAKSKLCGH